MMEEKQLRKLRLFRKVGVFSVVREKPRDALKSIAYAADILREKTNRAVWIFPQGEILPNDIRPLGFYNGLTKIIEKVGICNVLPVAMRFEFLGDFKPDIFVKIGEPEVFNNDGNFISPNTTRTLENRLIENLNVLKTQIVTKNLEDYQKIY
jgi:1-acyl-sn-glycerol-3-phosphate acyltransferase